MIRRFLAVLLLLLAITVAIMTPLFAFTPLGRHLLNGLRPATPTPSPTPMPLILTPLPSPTPILTAKDAPPVITSEAAYLLDMDTGNVLANINGAKPLPMASTTKIMTALIAIQTGNLDQLVTIKQDAYDEVHLRDGSSAQLVVGDQIPLKDLLYGLLLPSGDDAAIAIADALAGTPENFVQRMNLFAYHLHLFQTHYLDPDGLTVYTANGPDPDHYTTAADLVRLARYALSIPLFAQIVQTRNYKLDATAQHHAYTWITTNTLLGTYPGLTGIKTGHTVEAGYCLVFSATRNGHHLIGTVLHNTDDTRRFNDARALLNWGFALPLLPPT
jgi:serine-type D-Ala-D-Ala carboxypeptidase (penicillin-binding protein 5/6)